MNKKAQAAMEFLSTWGFALLAILLALVAMGYMGLFSAWDYVPEECYLGTGLYCMDSKYESGSVTFIIKNNKGEDIKSIITKIDNCSIANGPVELKDNEKGSFVSDCNFTGRIWKGNFYFSYVGSESDLNHTDKGYLTIKLR